MHTQTSRRAAPPIGRIVALVLLALTAAACGSGGAEADPEPGPTLMEARVDASQIRAFSDPSSQLDGVDDLVAYLLPGMSGPGVECVRSRLSADVIGMTPADGARSATSVVGSCLDGPSMGRLLAAYAYGFGPDAAERLPESYPCVASELARLDRGRAEDAVRAVLEVRLDLTGPVGSPQVAGEQIDALTDCETGGAPGSGSGAAPTTAGSGDDLAVGDCVILEGTGAVGPTSQVTETSCLGDLTTHAVIAVVSSAAACPAETQATVSRSTTGSVVCLGPNTANSAARASAQFPTGSCVSVQGQGLAAKPTPLPCGNPAATDTVVVVLASTTGTCPAPATRSALLPMPDIGKVCLRPKSG